MARDGGIFTEAPNFNVVPAAPQPADQGAVPRALGRVAGELAQLSFDWYRADQEKRVLDAQLQQIKGFAALREQAANASDNDWPTIKANYDTGAAEIKRNSMPFAKDEKTRQAIEGYYEREQLRANDAIFQIVTHKKVSAYAATLQEITDLKLKSGLTDPDLDHMLVKTDMADVVQRGVAGNFISAKEGMARLQAFNQTLDYTTGLQLVTDSPAQALAILEAKYTEGQTQYAPGTGAPQYGYLRDLDETKRLELIQIAKSRIGAMRASSEQINADIDISTIELDRMPSAQTMADIGSGAFSPQQVQRFQARIKAGLEAHSIIKQLELAPKSQWESIISPTGMFKGGAESLDRQHAEEAVRRAAQKIEDLWRRDPALAATSFMPPGNPNESMANRVTRRVGAQRARGETALRPYTNEEVAGKIAFASAANGNSAERSLTWERVKFETGNDPALLAGAYAQLRAQGAPAEFFALDPANPALTGAILRSLEAQQEKRLGKDIPDTDKTRIRQLMQIQAQDAPANRDLWIEAGIHLAETLHQPGDPAGSVTKAWNLLYANTYQKIGPVTGFRAWAPEVKQRVGDVAASINARLSDLPLMPNGYDPTTGNAELGSASRWIVTGDNDTLQLVDNNQNPILLKSGAPVQLRVSDLPRLAQRDEAAVEANKPAQLGPYMTDLGALVALITPRRPESVIPLDVLVAYLEKNAASARPAPPVGADVFKPLESRPALVSPDPRARNRPARGTQGAY